MNPAKAYREAVAFLYEQLPLFQREGATAYKPDLSNTLALLDSLGNPHLKFRSIHIAGTNGKGSVTAMLNSILMEAGYKSGMYTSPHLLSFTERIRVKGKNIPASAVVRWVEALKPAIKRLKPSFFEVTTALAFAHFAAEIVDLAVIETGLGGRLDSTNVLTPEVSVITQIGYDHQAILGDTLPLIAREKAGIIKAGVPAVIGETHPETACVFQEVAARQKAPLVFADQQRELTPLGGDWQFQDFQLTEGEAQRLIRLDLPGHYQAANLLSCLEAVAQLRNRGWNISEAALSRGLSQVRSNSKLRGRMELLSAQPLLIADLAHNEAGITAVVEQLAKHPFPWGGVLWGMMKDKSEEKTWKLLPKDATYYFVQPDLPRAMEAGKLLREAKKWNLRGKAYPSVAEGLQALLAEAQPHTLNWVGGSSFVVAEALQALSSSKRY
jgi:dihydrofolate synthase/folylpolyglutamate synthase